MITRKVIWRSKGFKYQAEMDLTEALSRACHSKADRIRVIDRRGELTIDEYFTGHRFPTPYSDLPDRAGSSELPEIPAGFVLSQSSLRKAGVEYLYLG